MSARDQKTPEVITRYSPARVRWFTRWLRGYFRRNFDAVRLSRTGLPPTDEGAPLLVYTNHPSWWDPIHFLLLARESMPERRMFGPFDAEALKQYGFFRRLGAFGIDPSTRAGVADFLLTSRAILDQPDGTLWITAQGEFGDPRKRPIVLRSGVAHLVRNLERGLVVPLAVEYPFWNERHPEALSAFGEPFDLAGAPDLSTEQWNERLSERLAATMDSLAETAATRDPDRFHTLVMGRSGIGGGYDAWRRMKAMVRGERFDPSHQDGRR